MRDASAESLVNVGRPESAGIITIRRSVLVAAGLTAVVLGLLAAWLIHSNAPSAAVAAPLPARAADASTIDDRVARGVTRSSCRRHVPRQTRPPIRSWLPTTEPFRSRSRSHRAPHRLANNRDLPLASRWRLPVNRQTRILLERGARLSKTRAIRALRSSSMTPGRPKHLDRLRWRRGCWRRLGTGRRIRDPAGNDHSGVALHADRLNGPRYCNRAGTAGRVRLNTSYVACAAGLAARRRLRERHDERPGAAVRRLRFIKLPNGHTINLGNMPGVDLQGVAGFGGRSTSIPAGSSETSCF